MALEDSIFNFFSTLALAPPFSSLKRYSTGDYKVHKIYAVCILMLVLFTFLFGLYGKCVYVHQSLEYPVILFSQLAYFSVVIPLTIAIYMGSYSCEEDIKTMIHIILKAKSSLNITTTKTTVVFNVTFVGFFLVVVHTIAYDCFVWLTSTNWVLFQYYLGDDMLYIHFSAAAFMLFCYLQYAERICRDLNKTLSKTRRLIFQSSLTDINEEGNLKSLYIWYGNLYVLIDLINSSFGYILLGATLEAILIILNNLVIFLIYYLIQNNIDGMGFGYEMIYLGISWTLTSMVSQRLKFVNTKSIKANELKEPQ